MLRIKLKYHFENGFSMSMSLVHLHKAFYLCICSKAGNSIHSLHFDSILNILTLFLNCKLKKKLSSGPIILLHTTHITPHGTKLSGLFEGPCVDIHSVCCYAL